jgi:hypothetical protein
MELGRIFSLLPLASGFDERLIRRAASEWSPILDRYEPSISSPLALPAESRSSGAIRSEGAAGVGHSESDAGG